MIGLLTTCFPDTQLKLPSKTSPLPWLLTVTLNVFFSPALVNTSVPGDTRTVRDLGASTSAVYVDAAGPTFVTVRLTVNGAGCSGTVIAG